MMFTPFVRSAYNYDQDDASNEAGLKCEGESLTQQEFIEESDINTIVRKFGVTGQIPESIRMPTYGDFTGISDFRSAVEAVMRAEESFMELNADVRKRFDNDPQRFLEFCMNPDTPRKELADLGLLTPEAVQAMAPAAPAPEVKPA